MLGGQLRWKFELQTGDLLLFVVSYLRIHKKNIQIVIWLFCECDYAGASIKVSIVAIMFQIYSLFRFILN